MPPFGLEKNENVLQNPIFKVQVGAEATKHLYTNRKCKDAENGKSIKRFRVLPKNK